MPGALAEIEEQESALLDDSGGPPTTGLGNLGYFDDHRPHTPPRTYTTGMLVAFAASSMFFLALVSASVVHRGMPGSDWMPLQPPSILWVTSSIAIISSITVVKARRCLTSGTSNDFARWWTITAALGVVFLCGQILAWRQLVAAGIYMKSNPSVSFFYVFTVAHGLHLLGGVVALLWIGHRRYQGSSLNTATALASMYWHFVTVLWLCLFSFFLIGG